MLMWPHRVDLFYLYIFIVFLFFLFFSRPITITEGGTYPGEVALSHFSSNVSFIWVSLHLLFWLLCITGYFVFTEHRLIANYLDSLNRQVRWDQLLVRLPLPPPYRSPHPPPSLSFVCLDRYATASCPPSVDQGALSCSISGRFISTFGVTFDGHANVVVLFF